MYGLCSMISFNIYVSYTNQKIQNMEESKAWVGPETAKQPVQ